MSSRFRQPGIMDIFVQRPVLSIVISLAIVLIGLHAATTLPVLQFPKIESSSLVIKTAYVGAPAPVVQGFITDPIERAAASIPGIDYIDSSTVAGLSTVTVWLKLNENSTNALAELSTRLSQIRSELPPAAQDPVVNVQRADRPNAAIYLNVFLNGRSRAQVTDYLTRHVNPVLAAIAGVQRVTIEGGRHPAMRIWLDPVRMAAFNVSAQDIEAALTANNIIATIGHTKNSNRRIDLLTNSALSNVADFEQLVIRDVDGSLIRIRDVARVELGAEEGDHNAMRDQKKTVFLAIWPLPGANEIVVANQLYQRLDQINPTLPDGMKIIVGYDITHYMREALREIFITLAETVLLVGLVVLAFMGSLRTALVPLVTIPVSLLGAIAAISFMGFSLNLLTVLAIVLSVGLVVDDAIVVVENVARHMRHGKTRLQAALISSRQLLTPIIGMTITLAAVYTPIGFLSGLTGALFKEFAFTLAIAVLISGLVALTLSPIMSAYACPVAGRENTATVFINRGFIALQRLYMRILDRTVRWWPQVITLGLFFSLLCLPFYLFSQKELAPVEDQSSIIVVFEAPPEASLDYTTAHMRHVVDTMATLPGSDFMWQVIYPSAGFSGMEFVAYDQREHSVHELLRPAFQKLSAVTGLKALPILPPALPTAGKFAVELVVLSPESPQQMKQYADKMIHKAYQSGHFMFAKTDLRIDLPVAYFALKKDKIADLGMNIAEVSRQLGVLLSGNYISHFELDGKAYRVIPMIENYGRPDPHALMDLKLRTAQGDLIPVSSIATLKEVTAPRALAKFQQKNAFRIFGGIMPGTTKEQALTVLEDAAADILPANYIVDYSGESRQLRQEGNTLLSVLGFALVFVFLVLAIQFNSFTDPLIVLLGSVPLALSGAMLFSFLGWTSINIYSQVGFITLIGLIAKNAILIVEFANYLQEEGYSRLKAIKTAAATRLRPVLMTTGATVLGHFPLVLVCGAGAQARNSIGIILVAGMLVGTLFTLLVLPSVYVALASTHRRSEKKPEHKTPGPRAA